MRTKQRSLRGSEKQNRIKRKSKERNQETRVTRVNKEEAERDKAQLQGKRNQETKRDHE
ncbi:hypothetical protein AVEN_106567-1, partial [Araneus ventricosus]